MRSKFAVCIMILSILLVWITSSPATVEWNVDRTLNIKENPRDAAIAINGRWIFVLTDKGEILIYSSDGKLKDTISVGESVDGIKMGPREDILLLTSREGKTVQVITLDFIQEINVSGSPFKGTADAPVVVAIFTDFQ